MPNVTTQDLLIDQLKVIFPNEKLLINSRKLSQVRHSADTHDLELDIWYPNLNICFEFQDSYHYVTAWYNHRPIQLVQQRDEKKKDIVAQKKIRLLVIGCWWDGTLDSLISTINFHCPDVLAPSSIPLVTLNPPFNFFPEFEIPDVGQLSYPSSLLDPVLISQTNWWMGEKYDGFRCCWNPVSRKVYSRQGNELLLPNFLCSYISSVFLDGELWFGRSNFSDTFQLLHRSQEQNDCWDQLRLIGFEAVDSAVQKLPFEEARYWKALQNIAPENPFVIMAARLMLPKSETLDYFAQQVIQNAGEGVILQKFYSIYESGRSQSILKFKMTLQDQEGMVVAISNKEVQLSWPNKNQVTVPIESVHLSNLTLGEVVTFSSTFGDFSNPVIYRRRHDISWQNLVHMQEINFSHSLNTLDKDVPENNFDISEVSPNLEHETRQFLGNYAEQRRILENFAKENNFDPLNPENWYQQRTQKLKTSADVRNIIVRGYDNRTSKALMNLFPEIGLEKIRFAIPSRWADPKNRRLFFEKYAKKNGFDPLNPENWYLRLKNKLFSTKGARQILRYHRRNITKCLLDLFPDIGLDKTKLSRSQGVDLTRQRQFFEKYAQEHNFDPLISENWQLHSDQIKKLQFARKIMYLHNNSLSTALKYLFPELNFSRDQFRKEPFYHNTENRRNLFEKYAKENNFDPLVRENWYSQSSEKILEFKGAHAVIRYHNNNIPKALVDLFSEFGSQFDAAKRRATLKSMQKM